MLRGIGNIGSPWVGAVCACKTPRIAPPASTSATPAASAKQARAPIPAHGREVDDAAMPEFGESRVSAKEWRETCIVGIAIMTISPVLAASTTETGVALISAANSVRLSGPLEFAIEM